MMDQEQWRPTRGYAGYRISDQGRVWSEISHKFIRIRVDPRGYEVVQIRQDGASRKAFVHRLVAAAFVEGHGPEVRHLDGNPRHNDPSNLAWGTHADNMADRVRHGRDPHAVKTHCPKGHPYDEANTKVTSKRGRLGRSCRACEAVSKSIHGKRQGDCSECGQRMRHDSLLRHRRLVHASSIVEETS